jgi:hypothetical protein
MARQHADHLLSTLFGPGWLRRPRNHFIVFERSSSSRFYSFSSRSETCERGMSERNVQPWKMLANKLLRHRVTD